MNHAQEPGKRIVSKREYAKKQGQRATIGILAVGLWVWAALCGLGALVSLYGGIVYLKDWQEDGGKAAVLCLGLMLLFAGGAFALGKLAWNAMQVGNAIDPGIPLTRANTADLPALESLVRASEAPMQAQEAVLLRAAIEGQETPPEQLVRAVHGQE